jgi:sugar O-acyltransferase (sialic acid O-acetyltransferase NeuD family)
MDKILIIGASGHGKVVIDILEKEGRYQIAGIIDKNKDIKDLMGYPVLGNEEEVPALVKDFGISGGFIAIGDNWTRKLVRDRICERIPDFRFVSPVHPSAQIARMVRIGTGTVIMAGAIVNPGSFIGDFCIVNTNACLDHDSGMQDFSSLAPGVTVGGLVKIGKFSALSLGSNVIHGLEIGEHTIIGAGSLVNKNIGSYKIAYGIPAKEIRDRVAGEKYL